MIAIIDYGLGNLGSISNMLKVVGVKSKITCDESALATSEGLILPGVGAFDAGMDKLKETGLDSLIVSEANKGKPILGICLGMQLLGMRSEEGVREGLSLIHFESKRFIFENKSLKVPHMGWDVVNIKTNHPIVDGLTDRQRYYFVHSYHAVCSDPANILMTCDYGYEFVAAVVKDNIIGVQFHPEKSHNFGLAIFKNFVNMCSDYHKMEGHDV